MVLSHPSTPTYPPPPGILQLLWVSAEALLNFLMALSLEPHPHSLKLVKALPFYWVTSDSHNATHHSPS